MSDSATRFAEISLAQRQTGIRIGNRVIYKPSPNMQPECARVTARTFGLRATFTLETFNGSIIKDVPRDQIDFVESLSPTKPGEAVVYPDLKATA